MTRATSVFVLLSLASKCSIGRSIFSRGIVKKRMSIADGREFGWCSTLSVVVVVGRRGPFSVGGACEVAFDTHLQENLVHLDASESGFSDEMRTFHWSRWLHPS
ncbi:hypothetical protein BJ741DRAFT_621781 [Chytriomyces cf. hyalinus JEL632]|nr:hypothetical protein BJ741DRAFT_621781 [Chytriomyces cf. hyalinus JEL632]